MDIKIPKDILDINKSVVIYLLLVYLAMSGCSKTPAPVQVTGPVRFERYIVTPPYGYWFFPQRIPADFRKKPHYLFVMTYWKNKEGVESETRRHLRADQLVFFNFDIVEYKYNSFGPYYDEMKQAGIRYIDLTDEEEILKTIPDWSCKRVDHRTQWGIQCISLKDDLLVIGVYGNNKDQISGEIPELKKMIESLRIESK